MIILTSFMIRCMIFTHVAYITNVSSVPTVCLSGERCMKGIMTMDFSEKIKNARLAKGMSQSSLARESGISLRTVQNYELGARMPKKRETYTHLARALGISEDVLLDENAAFVIRANEEYGHNAAKQAWDLVSDFSAMCAGGSLEDEDMDAVMQARQEAYWEAKKNNRKYVPKKYRKDDDG